MIMPKHISLKKDHQRGFTLLELLIVVGIVGILAVGLLAAIDPLEQLKKGRDTQKRSIAVEYNNALTRYYAIKGSMPWGTGATGPVTLSDADAVVTADLIAVGELKPTFTNALPAGAGDSITIYGESLTGGGAIFVCFNPESKGISLDPGTLFTDSSGSTGAACPSTSDTAACWFCSR